MKTYYAKDTSVSVSKSKEEIERLITKYGARNYACASLDGAAIIVFEVHNRRVRFDLVLPSFNDIRSENFRTPSGRYRTKPLPEEKIMKIYEQACRSRWRSLALVIKAKLEAVNAQITTFEDEFLAHIVLPGGETVGQRVRPQIEGAYNGAPMDAFLLLGSGTR